MMSPDNGSGSRRNETQSPNSDAFSSFSWTVRFLFPISPDPNPSCLFFSRLLPDLLLLSLHPCPVSTFSFRISLYVLSFTGQQILVLILTIHMLVETIQRDGRLVSYLSFLSLFLVDVVHSVPLQYPLHFHFLRIQFHGGPLILVSLPYL